MNKIYQSVKSFGVRKKVGKKIEFRNDFFCTQNFSSNRFFVCQFRWKDKHFLEYKNKKKKFENDFFQFTKFPAIKEKSHQLTFSR